ncbi:MAG: cell division protein FtsH, partial [Chloroflexi bacterium]|nr:cell division protein FtsH [Chloroflexota bacterium]
FDEITSGASSDLEQATNIARTMVTRYGMSEKLGPRTFGKREELVFLGRDLHEQRDYSDRVAHAIDEEVRSLIDGAYQNARKVLTSHKDKLSRLARYLISNETIEAEHLDELLASQTPPTADAAPA